MSKDVKKSKKKWTRRRHGIIKGIAATVLYPFAKIKYGAEIEKFKNQGKRHYLVISNHQNDFDQFFVGMCIKGPVYFVGSEELFSLGFLSKLLRWAVNPIPIKKSATDVGAVLNCARVAKEGATIALFPEGNRTFSGKTGYVKPGIAGLCKMLKLPVCVINIVGGYGTQPRWSDNTRKGKTRVFVKRVIEYEEYRDMSDEALYDLLYQELNVDERNVHESYFGKKLAENLERVYYVCPDCGLTHFKTKGDLITCGICGKQMRYMPDKSLQGLGWQPPFNNATDWYEYQEDFVRRMDLNAFGEDPVYTDTETLKKVILGKNKELLSDSAKLTAYADKLTIVGGQCSLNMPYDEISGMTVQGRNKLFIYHGQDVYQIIANEVSFNAIKYMNLYYHYKNLKEGVTQNEFLGL